MTVEELIDRLKVHAGNNYEVFATDGNYLKPFTFSIYTGKTLRSSYELWDEDMIKNKDYLVFILED